MTSPSPTEGRSVTVDALDFVPELRTDFVRRDIGDECVVWSPLADEPVALDPVARVMLDVVDGAASVGALARDVHEAVGVPLETAHVQVARIVQQFASAGLLTASTSSSTADEAIARRQLFVSPSTPCSENSSRLGTVTLHLRFGEHTVRVACDSRRGARKLEAALAEHVVDPHDDVPLGFVLTAPQGFKRNHVLTDRAGFVLSEGRGLDAGLHALASHLTALLPPAPDTVRIRVRGVASDDRTILCVFPLLYQPTIEDRELVRAGLRVIDRLAVDVSVETGRVVNPPVPWPALAQLDPGPGHAGTAGSRLVDAVVHRAPRPGSAPPTRAALAAQLAASGLHGSPAELLRAAVVLTRDVEMLAARSDATGLVDVLR